MTLSDKEKLRWWTGAMLLIAVGLSIYFAVFVWRRVDKPQVRENGFVVPNHSEDYAYFYAGGKAMREGRDIYAEVAPFRDRAGYIYPPLIAFLYQPLAGMDFIAGAHISLLFGMAAMATALGFASRALLERFAPRGDKMWTAWPAVLSVAVFALLLSTDKIKGEFQMLQTNSFVALGIALGLYLLDRKPLLAGLAIGFAINIKYQALGLLLYVIFRKRWKAAGATVVGTAFWAFLPALSVGFKQDAHYLVSGFSGVLRLVGFKTDGVVANIEPLSGSYSVSLTSAAARLKELDGLHVSPFVLSGSVAVIWLVVLAGMYMARKVPPLAWPGQGKQSTPPWRVMAGVEWMAVIASVLAFSPETNSRHLVQTALVNVLGVVLVIAARGRMRVMAVAAVIILWMGLNLPPGNLGDRNAAAATQTVKLETTTEPHNTGEAGSAFSWHWISGPTWALLVAVGMMTWVGLSIAKARAREEGESVTSPVPQHA